MNWPEVDALTHEHSALWHTVPDLTPQVGELVPWRRQRRGARAAKRLVSSLLGDLGSWPEGAEQASPWRRRVEERVRLFGEEYLGWPSGYRHLLLADDAFRGVADFVRRARDFAPAMALEDVTQALRNVGIVMSAQMLLEREVALTPSVFAYSMLYPYTDNYLDDAGLPAAAKAVFSRRLGRRLAGLAVDPSGPREQDVFRLVEIIEDEFPRRRFPDVHLALQAIHRAQVRSLKQHDGHALAEGEVLRISVEKGGTSVLADAFLVGGNLTRQEASFFFAYGVFLQLLDDLQDLARDRRMGHATLFSRCAEGEALDRLAGRLFCYMTRVLDEDGAFGTPQMADCKDLIRRNCSWLFVAAVAEHRRCFSRSFRRQIERRWPLSLRAMRRLRRMALRRWRRCESELCGRYGVESVVDLEWPA